MKHLFVQIFLPLVFMAFLSETGFAQSNVITGNLSMIDGTPLVGANVHWVDTDIGTITDEKGEFSISDEGIEKRTLVYSYIGFKTEKLPVGGLKRWEIQLIEDNTLAAVEIKSDAKATRFANTAAKIEVIGTNEIERAACCSLAGCFSTNSNVVAAVTNALTDAKELQMLGLSGVYNQVLFDEFLPIKGLFFTYGTGSYPGTLIQSIYVAKGANSVLQGAQSISGQINIIPQDAREGEKIYLNAFANSFGESQYNANFKIRKDRWSNLTTVHATLPAQLRDKDGDGFRDIVHTNRISIFNKWVLDNPKNDNLKLQFSGRYWKERREGGQMEYNREQHLGSLSVYGQDVDLNHLDLSAKASYSLTDDLSITFQNASFFNQQDNHFGAKQYIANQVNHNTNLFTDYFYGTLDNNLKVGLSLELNQLSEDIIIPEELNFMRYGGNYNGDYTLPGIFVQNTFNFEKITLIAGLRADQFEQVGLKWSPRLLMRYKISEQTDARFSVGKGVRNAMVFSERINLLSGNRNVIFSADDILRPEEAINAGVNLIHNIFGDDYSITLSGDYYYTFFQNQIVPDYDSEVTKVFVGNFTDKSISESIQLEAKFEFKEWYDAKVSYNFLNLYQVREGEERLLPFIPRHKFLATQSFVIKEDWQFDLTYKWIGEQRLPSTINYPAEYQREGFSESYQLIDWQLTKRWPQFEIYGGMENIFDFRQVYPILAFDDPFGSYFDPSFVWGPTKGRELYLGVRYRIN